MTHQKRLPAPKHYPIKRKAMKYISTMEGSRSPENAIPVVVFLRDVLEYADDSKEAKKIVRNQQLLRNGSPVTDIRQGIGILDTVEIPETEEVYRVVRKGEDLNFVPVNDSKVVAKITGKRTEGDEYVYQLHTGENYRVEEDFETGSTLVDDGSVKEISLEEGVKVLVIAGRHAGEVAEVKELQKGGLGEDTTRVESDQEFETRLENLVAVDGVKVTE